MIKAYGDARLFALNHLSTEFSKSAQPLVPERVFITGGKDGEGNALGLLSTLLGLLVSEKSGIKIAEGNPELAELEKVVADAQAKQAEEAAAQAASAKV